MGLAGSGHFAVDARLRFEVWLKIDLRLGLQTVSHTLAPAWDAVTRRGVAASALRGNATRVQVFDADVVGDDAIGTCSFFIPATVFAPGLPVQTATGCSGDGALRCRLRP